MDQDVEVPSANALCPAALVDRDAPLEHAPTRYPLGLCLSGGGYRAMMFHAGVLFRLNQAGILPTIGMVSSVSGGSIVAGFLASVWKGLTFDGNGVATNFSELVFRPLLEFNEVFTDAPSIVKGLVSPTSTAAEIAARVFETRLLGSRGLRLKDLPESPWFVFCSSNLTTGSLFRMSNRFIADYRIGLSRDANIPLATAIAASAAFPPFLSPLRMDLSGFTWENDKLDSTVGSIVKPTRAILTDGGVYDNHGLEPALKRCDRLLVSDAGAPWQASDSAFRNWYSLLRRVLDTTDNQVRSLRRRDLIDRFDAAKTARQLGLPQVDRSALRADVEGVYWSISTRPEEISAYQSYSYDYSEIDPAELPTFLHFLGARETETTVNWGHHVCDGMLRRFFEPTPAIVPGPPLEKGEIHPGRVAAISKQLLG